MKRSHDKFYLDENNHNIKQAFVDVANEIDGLVFNSIADIGCAAGAFSNYLSARFPRSNITGIDYLQPLIDKATMDFPHIRFIKGNILDGNSIQDKFDIITMMGVLCIFDDYKLVLENALSWLNPNGKLILHNMISEYDIDVFIKYQPSRLEPDLHELESGWNIISEKSLSLVVEKCDARILSTKRFDLGIELKKQADVMRSWTETNVVGKRTSIMYTSDSLKRLWLSRG